MTPTVATLPCQPYFFRKVPTTPLACLLRRCLSSCEKLACLENPCPVGPVPTASTPAWLGGNPLTAGPRMGVPRGPVQQLFASYDSISVFTVFNTPCGCMVHIDWNSVPFVGIWRILADCGLLGTPGVDVRAYRFFSMLCCLACTIPLPEGLSSSVPLGQ